MAHGVRNAWKANRHWVAAGFLASTSLFLLFIFLTWRNERRGIEQSRATGASAATPTSDSRSQWSVRIMLPTSFARKQTRSVDCARGVAGGLPGSVDSLAVPPPPPPTADV